jgi:hypothetical protein
LKRSERIAFLKAEDRWGGTETPFGLPKIRVVKTTIGKKKKKKAEEEEAEGAAAGKPAAPAKGAKK